MICVTMSRPGDMDRVTIVSIDTDGSDNVTMGAILCPSGTQRLRHKIDMTQMGDTDRMPGLCRFIL